MSTLIPPTTYAAAKYLGLAKQTVTQSRRQGRFPSPGPDGWDPADLDAWKASRMHDGGIRGTDTGKPTAGDLLEAKSRKIKADAIRAEHEAKIAERKLARLSGESVARKDVDGLLTHIAQRQQLILASIESELLPKFRTLPPEEWAAEWRAKEADIYEQMQKIVADWKPGDSEDEA